MMGTKHLLDPDLVAHVESSPILEFTLEALPTLRKIFRERAELQNRMRPQQIRQTAPREGAPAIDLHIFNHDPDRSGRPLFLHIHGGAFILGHPSWVWMETTLAATDAVAISVDYRLAPECPFPGPQEDCYAALMWAVEHAAELGIDPKKIVVSGESAGGGFAAALAIMARDRGEVQLAGQALVYPALDHRTCGPDCQWKNSTTGEFILTRENGAFAWMCLKGEYGVDDERAPYFSPALLEDFTGLPAAYIMVGGLDRLVDETIDYARRMNAAGVSTELHVYPGAPHAFDFAAGDFPLKTNAVRDYVAGVRRLLGIR